jgi:histone H2A
VSLFVFARCAQAELSQLLHGVTVASGGVLPNIHAVLLPKKKEKKEKDAKSTTA